MHYSSVPSRYCGQGKKKNVTQLSPTALHHNVFYVLRKRALSIDKSIKTSAIRYIPQEMGGVYLT